MAGCKGMWDSRQKAPAADAASRTQLLRCAAGLTCSCESHCTLKVAKETSHTPGAPLQPGPVCKRWRWGGIRRDGCVSGHKPGCWARLLPPQRRKVSRSTLPPILLDQSWQVEETRWHAPNNATRPINADLRRKVGDLARTQAGHAACGRHAANRAATHSKADDTARAADGSTRQGLPSQPPGRCSSASRRNCIPSKQHMRRRPPGTAKKLWLNTVRSVSHPVWPLPKRYGVSCMYTCNAKGGAGWHGVVGA